jgi:nitrogen fixation protein NifU and related proteins
VSSDSVLNPAAGFLYSAPVHKLFAHLTHAGALPDAKVTVAVGSVEQGASVIWTADVQNHVVVRARYQAYGCPHFLAGCESLARWLQGRPVSELANWRWQELETLLAAPAAKRSRWLLLEDVVIRLAKAAGAAG